MSRQSKQLFDKDNRYSIRKFSVGVASVLIGSVLFMNPSASAEEGTAEPIETEAILAESENAPTVTTVQATPVTPTSNSDQNLPENDAAAITTTETTIAAVSETVSSTESNTERELTERSVSETEAAPTDMVANPFAEDEVIKVENIKLSEDTNNRHALSQDQLNTMKTLQDATIVLEFKSPENAPNFYNLLSASSSTHKNEYFTLSVNNGVAIVEGRGATGNQFYDSYNEAPLRVNNGEWNTIAFTVEQPKNAQQGRVRLYVNGVLSKTSSKSANFIKDMPDVNHLQLGKTIRQDQQVWGSGTEFKAVTVYDRALTQEEVARRSRLYNKERVDVIYPENVKISEKIEVFAGGRNNQKNDENVYSYRIPAMIVTDQGTIITGGDERKLHYSDWGDIAMVVRRSTDHGATWGDKVVVMDLQDNPNAPNRNTGSAYGIDMALVQDPQTKKIFAIYDMFPQIQGLFGLKNEAPYTKINEKSYLNLYKSGETGQYTIRENGQVFTPDGQTTNYRVVTETPEAGHGKLGDIYEGDRRIGNVYFIDNSTSPFRIARTNYLWVSESTDDGLTWSSPKDITPMVKESWMDFYGVGPGNGIVLKHGDKAGRIIFPMYSTNRVSGLGGSQSSRVIYSDDHGVTWQSGKAVNDGRIVDGAQIQSETMRNTGAENTEAAVVELNSGKLLIFMRNHKGTVAMASSTDAGQTWSPVSQIAGATDVYVQLSATHYEKDGKEYVLLSNADGPRRYNGVVRVAEVGANDELNWIHKQPLEYGKYAYNVIAPLADDQIGVLYEHSENGGNDYSLYFKKFNWDFLTNTDAGTPVPVHAETITETKNAQQYAVHFDGSVLAVGRPNLQLQNGQVATFVSQLDANTLVYEVSAEGLGQVAASVNGGQLENVNKQTVDITTIQFSSIKPMPSEDITTGKTSGELVIKNGYYDGDTLLDKGTTPIGNNLTALNNGTATGSQNDRWTNWKLRANDPKTYVELDWMDGDKTFEKIHVWHFTDDATGGDTIMPPKEHISFQYEDANGQWVDIAYRSRPDLPIANGETVYTLANPVTTDKLRLWLQSGQRGHNIGLSEIKVMSYVESESEALLAQGTIVDSNLRYTQDKYDVVRSQEETKQQTLSAWKNDHAVSQISIASGSDALHNVQVSVSDFTNAQGRISKEHISAKFIKSVLAHNGFLGYGNPDRPMPVGNRQEANEVIYSSDPVTVDAESLQNIWLDIKVPKDVTAGTYTGQVTVTSDDLETPMTFNYTLNVANAELPDATEFKNGFDIELWQNPNRVAEYYDVTPFSQEHFDILRPHMEKYRELGGHAVTTTIVEEAWSGQTYGEGNIKFPSMVKWIKQSDGTFRFDYTDFDKWVAFNKELGIGDKIVAYSVAPWNNKIIYHDEVENRRKETPYRIGDSTYTELYRTFLTDFMVHMEQKGWKENTYIGIDERGFSASAFDLIDSIRGTDGKPFKTAGAMDHFVEKRALAMRVDDLNIGSLAIKAHPAEFEQLRQEREALGLRTTMYTATEHKPGNFALSAPGESYWTMMYAASKGGEGFLRWAYDSWVADPLVDVTHNAFEAGDTFLIYPDVKTAQNPVSKSSLRLEKMAEAVRDVNKLLIIKEETPSLASKVDEIFALVKPVYDSGRYYLTAVGKHALSADMTRIKQKIAELTEEYIRVKETGTNDIDSIAIVQGESLTLTLGQQHALTAQFAPNNVINTHVLWQSDSPDIVRVNTSGVIEAMGKGRAIVKAISQQDATKHDTIEIIVERAKIDDAAKVAYYTFDDETNRYNDTWGDRDGESASAEIVEGPSGSAVKLSNNQHISFDHKLTLGKDWTVGFWLKNDDIPNDRSSIFTSADGVYSIDNRISSTNNKPGVHVVAGNGGFLSYRHTPTVGEWTHYTWTNSATDGLKLFINGEFEQANSWTVSHDFNAPVDIIGGTGFNGAVDEVKIYNRPLTEEEVRISMLVNGLNVPQHDMTLFVDESQSINADYVTESDNTTIEYQSSNPEIATVDSNGVVTAVAKGNTTITIHTQDGKYTKLLPVKVQKLVNIHYTIPQYELPDHNLSDIEKAPNTDRQYLGQPDMILLDDNETLITAYPKGHGSGPIIMQVSRDGGETWQEKTDVPESWAHSYETPTLYKLNLSDGSTKLMMITGRPNWHNNTQGGWQTSVSNDNGESWSDYQTFHPNKEDGTPNWSIVAMSSLVQLKDEQGNYKDEWMGVYHNYDYVNYRTTLTFDENGNEQWSAPVPLIPEHREIEMDYQICELGIFRSPDGTRLIALGRAQSHNNHSIMMYSDDEGLTWSEPEDMQGALQGERHKVAYDPISNRILVTFREILLDYNQNNQIERNDWKAGDWVAWVGTYDDLMAQNEGQYRILLEEDWSNNAKSGDTGYAGVTVQEDGTFILDSYGHWDKEFSQNWRGGVTTDLAYIKQAKFKLGQIDQALGLVDKAPITTAINSAAQLTNQDSYTTESWTAFTQALNKARQTSNSVTTQQIEIDNALAELQAAQDALIQIHTEMTTTTEIVPKTVVNDPNLLSGQDIEGHDGEVRITTITRRANNQVIGVPTVTRETITEMVPDRHGTGQPTVVSTSENVEIPIETIQDATLPEGSVQDGKVGVKTITTTIKTFAGEEIERLVTETITTAMQPKRVGTKKVTKPTPEAPENPVTPETPTPETPQPTKPVYETSGINVTVDPNSNLVTFLDNDLDTGISVTLDKNGLHDQTQAFVVQFTEDKVSFDEHDIRRVAPEDQKIFEAYFESASHDKLQIDSPATVVIPVDKYRQVENVYYISDDATQIIGESLPWAYTDSTEHNIAVTLQHFSKYLIAYKPGISQNGAGVTAPEKPVGVMPSEEDESTGGVVQTGNVPPVLDISSQDENATSSKTSTATTHETTTTNTTSSVTQTAIRTSKGTTQETSNDTSSLPETGEANGAAIFGIAALSIISGLGLITRKEETN